MSAQHTPGPWSYAHRMRHDGMYNTEVFCEAGVTIASLSWYPMPKTSQGVTGTYREGNARLIAAAPDMFGILQTIAKLIDEGAPVSMILDENSPTLDAIRDVLAKVAGGRQ